MVTFCVLPGTSVYIPGILTVLYYIHHVYDPGDGECGGCGGGGSYYVNFLLGICR